MAKQRSSRPSVNSAPLTAYHSGGNLKHDCRHIAVGEKILAVLPRLHGETFLFGERGPELPKRLCVSGEQVWREPCKNLDPALTRQRGAGQARGDEFAFDPFERVRAGRAQDLEGLDMMALVARGMFNRAESHLEGQLLPRIAVEIESEGVESFVTESLGRGDTRIGVHRHRHDCGAWRSLEKVEVANVDPRIFPGSWRVEMMGHGGLGNQAAPAVTK
jgi:hypothetical protein